MDLQTLGMFWAANSAALIRIAVILVITWLSLYLVNLSKGRLNKRIDKMDIEAGRRARLKTLVAATSYGGRGLILLVAAISLLGTLKINVAPLLASLGIVGLALSLGAQTLIKDYVGGVIVLLENLFVVGDDVQIGAVSGTVETFGLRATWVREINGRLTVIPNGDVRVVTNLSRGWAQAMIDLNLPFSADLGLVVHTLDGAMQQALLDPEIQTDLQSQPSIQGWNSQNDWSVQVRLTARTRVGRKFVVESSLRRYALEALNQAGIRLAQPGPNIYLPAP
jgi:small-conductance mechanosensitive channel